MDLGTSSLKGVLTDDFGKIIRKNKLPVPFVVSKNGLYEINPGEYYLVVCRLIKNLSVGKNITALSMASASGNTLLLGKDGKPVTNIICWLDERMKGRVKEIFPALNAKEVYKVVGWPLFDMLPPAHLGFFKEDRADIFKKAKTVCMSTEYVQYLLTGKLGIDRSTATPFYLVNQEKGIYHEPFLKIYGIKEKNLPKIMNSGEVLGNISKEGAKASGLNTRTLLVLGSFDHPACARGAGVVSQGQLLLSCGTSWVGFYPLRDRKTALQENMLSDPFLFPKGPWAGMFSITSLGQVIDKLISKYISQGNNKYKTLDKLALEAQKKGMKPCECARDPLKWEEKLKATEKLQAALSIMSWPCQLMKYKMAELSRSGMELNEIYMAGGPSGSKVWPAVMSNILSVPVKCVHGEYTGASGASVIAREGYYSQRRKTIKRWQLFPVKPCDKKIYDEELLDFLPKNIIDIHTHSWLKKFEIEVPALNRGPAWPGLVARDNSIQDLLLTYELLFPGKNVEPVIFGSPGRDINLGKTNSYAGEAAKGYGLKSLIISDPSWSREGLENKVKTGGFSGLKPYFNFAPKEIKSEDIRIYDFLPKAHLKAAHDNKWIVILHIPRPGRLKDPLNLKQLKEIDENYPNAKIVVAHLGRAYSENDGGNAFEILKRTNNLFFDFSANTNSVIMRRFIDAVGPGRIIFGSDLPITRMRMKRITENNSYVNFVPKGLYKGISSEPQMREVAGVEAGKYTFFLYEEILAFKKAARAAGLGREDVNNVFYRNAAGILMEE